MPEQVKIDLDYGIAEIVASDEVTIDQMTESWRQVAKACKSHRMTGLLYDGRSIRHPPSGDDLFDFTKRSIKSGRFQGIQLALVTSQESAFPHMFMAMPACQLGQYVRVFSDRQAALTWLGDGHG